MLWHGTNPPENPLVSLVKKGSKKEFIIMLDFRIKTFLKLCETKSYTNTAKILKMTQPSVTQHIKYLQNRYNCQLFNYEGKTLSLTAEGEFLRRQAQALSQQSSKVLEELKRMSERHKPLRFGCPKDLSCNIVPRLLGRMMESDEDLEVSLIVDSSAKLIEELENGRVDFVLADSSFEAASAAKVSFTKVRYSCWASPAQAEKLSDLTFRKVFREKLLIGEAGSASKVILEDILERRKCEISDFYASMVCSSPASITELAAANVGICFGFDAVMEEAAANGKISKVKLTDFNEERELVFLYLKDTLNTERSKQFFKDFKQCWMADRKSDANSQSND